MKPKQPTTTSVQPVASEMLPNMPLLEDFFSLASALHSSSVAVRFGQQDNWMQLHAQPELGAGARLVDLEGVFEADAPALEPPPVPLPPPPAGCGEAVLLGVASTVRDTPPPPL